MAISYDTQTLVSAFVRKANTQANPSDFLLNIVIGNVDVVTTGDATVLTSTTTGGSSGNWTLPARMSRMDITEIAELALRRIETGIDASVTTDPNTGARVTPPIAQVKASERLITYGGFGNIQR